MDKETKELISAAKGAQDCLNNIDTEMGRRRYDINRQWRRLQRAIDALKKKDAADAR